jgi:phospholipase/carboxylesterase
LSLTVITISPQFQSNIQGNVVIMHGWGANAQDAAYFTSWLQLPNVQLILPEAPFQHPYSLEGRMWYGLPEPLGEFDFQADFSHRPDLQTSRQLLEDFLQALPSKTGIPLEKTILGGFSQGGAMTIDLGPHLPLAGLMVLSGYLHSPLEIPNDLTMPILQVHGINDPVVPIAAARQAHQALLATGSSVQYEEIPQMGHEISPVVLEKMQTFIQQQLQL